MTTIEIGTQGTRRGMAKLVRRQAGELGRLLAMRFHGRAEDMGRAWGELADAYASGGPVVDGREVGYHERKIRFLSEFLAVGQSRLEQAVEDARAEGVTWGRIGDALGSSPQAAHYRYGRTL